MTIKLIALPDSINLISPSTNLNKYAINYHFLRPLFIAIVLKTLIEKHTHICFVFESEVTAWSSTMKMSRSLSVKSTQRCPTILSGAESLKTFLYNG